MGLTSSVSQDRIIMRRPDDWHVHMRDGSVLDAVADYTARQFGRAIIMPNLTPPVTTVAAGKAYRDRIIAATDAALNFTPLMTCYLTDTIDSQEIKRGFEQGVFTACKLYPANATTNSAHGVSEIENVFGALEVMQAIGMPLLLHGEVTDHDVDIFDREAVFVDTVLQKIIKAFPNLKVVLEHITTQEGAEFVAQAGDNIAATITPHHLDFNRNAIFKGGIRPHYYCLPIAKRERHRLALRKAATSGSPKFFLGTDTAPHTVERKLSACGCAGLFNAPCALESYATTFDQEDALDKLEGFASLNGPRFYGLPVSEQFIALERAQLEIADKIEVDDTHIVPFHAGATLGWCYAGIVSERT